MAKSQKKIPFTSEKYKQMQEKIAKLEAEHEQVMQRLITAREMGDLSENGAYKYAKFELGNIKRQLRRLQGLVSSGFPVPKQLNSSGVIDFGSTAVIQNKDTLKTSSVMIVSKHESDPSDGKIAYSSPLGKALMRKKAGDAIEFETPKGMQAFKILKVS